MKINEIDTIPTKKFEDFDFFTPGSEQGKTPKKTGRKPVASEKKLKNKVSVYLDDALYTHFLSRCEEEGVKPSWVLRRMVKSYIKD